ncbi:hypothetical protein PAT3040_06599 [Paenibacillus agaridevorans]|uniref:Uncharacterized protein n=1 Tax=Paenibacillus agaridevorans TaxID=171404 RepID=A0A2R5EYG7_9BACL|nr:hypothetical protein PAT3040_06599 [Paenibacillus agaridevorans]
MGDPDWYQKYISLMDLQRLITDIMSAGTFGDIADFNKVMSMFDFVKRFNRPVHEYGNFGSKIVVALR